MGALEVQCNGWVCEAGTAPSHIAMRTGSRGQQGGRQLPPSLQEDKRSELQTTGMTSGGRVLQHSCMLGLVNKEAESFSYGLRRGTWIPVFSGRVAELHW